MFSTQKSQRCYPAPITTTCTEVTTSITITCTTVGDDGKVITTKSKKRTRETSVMDVFASTYNSSDSPRLVPGSASPKMEPIFGAPAPTGMMKLYCPATRELLCVPINGFANAAADSNKRQRCATKAAAPKKVTDPYTGCSDLTDEELDDALSCISNEDEGKIDA